MSDRKQALKTLFDTYWSSSGWKMEHTTNPAAVQQAINCGVMFSPQSDTHENLMQRVCLLRNQITPKLLGAAFISSLSSKAVELRSALGSYSVALNMPEHSFIDCGHNTCEVCGSGDTENDRDLNVLNFERFKWGGVRHTQLSYIAFDLDRFSETHITEPLEKDWVIFQKLISIIDEAPRGQRLGDLVKSLSKVIPGNQDQRRTAVSMLGFAGVLEIAEHSGFFTEFTDYVDRTETPWHKDDWDYPVRWWTGGSGVNRDALNFWFPQDNQEANKLVDSTR